MIGYKKGGTGYCLIKVDNPFEVDTGAKGINNIPLVSDVTFQPERRARTSAIVIQEPLFLGNQPILQVNSGWPGYGPVRHIPDHDSDEDISTVLYSQGDYNYKVMSDIAPEVKIGDKAYFVWRVLFNRKNLIAETKAKSGDREWIYRLSYENIYCVVRDENIIMIGSYVLIDPILESWESIFVPTYSHIKDEHGKPILKPRSQWIQSKTAPAQKDRLGIVKHIGTPLRGDVCHLSVGDKVLYKPNLKSMITVEGVKYFCMRSDFVVAKVLD